MSDPTSNLDRGLFSRPQPYAQRRPLQPTFQPFPTTTIGSFPQTAEVRRLRAQLRSGALTQQQYETLIDQQVRGVDCPTEGGIAFVSSRQQTQPKQKVKCILLQSAVQPLVACTHNSM